MYFQDKLNGIVESMMFDDDHWKSDFVVSRITSVLQNIRSVPSENAPLSTIYCAVHVPSQNDAFIIYTRCWAHWVTANYQAEEFSEW